MKSNKFTEKEYDLIVRALNETYPGDDDFMMERIFAKLEKFSNV